MDLNNVPQEVLQHAAHVIAEMEQELFGHYRLRHYADRTVLLYADPETHSDLEIAQFDKVGPLNEIIEAVHMHHMIMSMGLLT